MRLWLKDSERRPDPTPVATDDRKAVLVGVALWVIGLAVALIVPAVSEVDAAGTWFYTCLVGLALGAVGLVYTHRRHR